MPAQCAANTRSGARCKGIATTGGDRCPAHDPKRADARRRAASKAGRSGPSREIVAVRARLSALAEDVLAGRVDRGDAAVAGQLLGTVIRAITAELKVKETVELEDRIQALEEARRWPA